VVLPGETGLLAGPERPQQLAAAIRYMLAQPGEAARMAAAGRRLITDKFTPEALAAVLEDSYEGGAGLARPGRIAVLAASA
jgi:glycosyltransferase involved in cell wall biosynthesis